MFLSLSLDYSTPPKSGSSNSHMRVSQPHHLELDLLRLLDPLLQKGCRTPSITSAGEIDPIRAKK